MEAVNLLPAYARPRHRWASVGQELSPARVLRNGGIAAAVVAVAISAIYLEERRVVSDRRAELADVRARLAAAEATAAPFRAAAAGVASRVTVVRAVDSTRVRWETVLRDLSRVMPTQAYLQSLQVQGAAPVLLGGGAAVTAPPTTAAGTFTVSGFAASHVRVALVLDRLALLPWLTGIALQSSTRGSGGAGATASGDTFSISGTFVSAGGPR